jgi:hypothetical protein
VKNVAHALIIVKNVVIVPIAINAIQNFSKRTKELFAMRLADIALPKIEIFGNVLIVKTEVNIL